MINFDLGKDGFKAECSDNNAAEMIIASGIVASLVVLTSAVAYAIVKKVPDSVVQLIED
ncbi:TPA: hypothetical protein ACPUUH_005482 [Klebsiella pneumoniae]